jgi:hypothetical protein
MGKEQTPQSLVPMASPVIHEAACGVNGSVVKGLAITQAQAQARRTAGKDVVVCGASLAANRNLAKQIEQNANGSFVLHPFHVNAGPQALPHCQPSSRPPAGHTFYETPNRKAV